MEGLADVLSLEINSDNLRANGFSHSESGRNCVDGVYFGSTLEECPLDDTQSDGTKTTSSVI